MAMKDIWKKKKEPESNRTQKTSDLNHTDIEIIDLNEDEWEIQNTNLAEKVAEHLEMEDLTILDLNEDVTVEKEKSKVKKKIRMKRADRKAAVEKRNDAEQTSAVEEASQKIVTESMEEQVTVNQEIYKSIEGNTAMSFFDSSLEGKENVSKEELVKTVSELQKIVMTLTKIVENNQKIIMENEEQELKEPPKPVRIISDVIFYVGILFILLVGISISQNTSTIGTGVYGYRMFNVLTGSMEREIPAGSLVIVKETPQEELKVGDNITFLSNTTTIVTHKIVNILTDDVDVNGGMGFQTQGTENASPDTGTVYYSNVVGKVVANINGVGYVLNYLYEHLAFVLVMLVLMMVFSFALRILLTPNKEREVQNAQGENIQN